MAKCKGQTAAGKDCNRNAPAGSAYCCQKHDPDNTDAIKKSWHDNFFVAFADSGLVKDACSFAGISRQTAYEERKTNPHFAERWEDVEEDTTQQMEREAIRRGMEGVAEPVIFKGEDTGISIQKYSDTLLIFMLKARRPETYRERVDVKHEGTIRTEVGVAVPKDASSDDLNAVADELAARRGRRAANVA